MIRSSFNNRLPLRVPVADPALPPLGKSNGCNGNSGGAIHSPGWQGHPHAPGRPGRYRPPFDGAPAAGILQSRPLASRPGYESSSAAGAQLSPPREANMKPERKKAYCIKCHMMTWHKRASCGADVWDCEECEKKAR